MCEQLEEQHDRKLSEMLQLGRLYRLLSACLRAQETAREVLFTRLL